MLGFATTDVSCRASQTVTVAFHYDVFVESSQLKVPQLECAHPRCLSLCCSDKFEVFLPFHFKWSVKVFAKQLLVICRLSLIKKKISPYLLVQQPPNPNCPPATRLRRKSPQLLPSSTCLSRANLEQAVIHHMWHPVRFNISDSWKILILPMKFYSCITDWNHGTLLVKLQSNFIWAAVKYLFICHWFIIFVCVFVCVCVRTSVSCLALKVKNKI